MPSFSEENKHFFNDYGKSNCTLQNNLVLFNLISVIHTQEMIKRQLAFCRQCHFYLKHCKPKCHLILLHRWHTAPTVRHVWVESIRGRCFNVSVISETVCFAVLRVEWNHSQTLLLLLEGDVKCSSLDSRGLTSWSYVSESRLPLHTFSACSVNNVQFFEFR